jgi:hypothetical protein
MIPHAIIKNTRQICMPTNCAITNLLAGLASLLAIVIVGCQRPEQKDPCKTVVSALNNEDWTSLRKLAPSGSRAIENIEQWKQHALSVGEPINGGKPEQRADSVRVYWFKLKYKNGEAHPHWLQIDVRKTPDGRDELVDFGSFGW